jgi:hypothetical protein
MAKKRSATQYNLGKQAERRALEKSGESIPTWWRTKSDNVDKDLNANLLEQILARVQAALMVEDCPAQELLEIEKQGKNCRDSYDAIRNSSSTQAGKYRYKVFKRYHEVCNLINNLNNATGFDLYDESTWTKSNSDTV